MKATFITKDISENTLGHKHCRPTAGVSLHRPHQYSRGGCHRDSQRLLSPLLSPPRPPSPLVEASGRGIYQNPLAKIQSVESCFCCGSPPQLGRSPHGEQHICPSARLRPRPHSQPRRNSCIHPRSPICSCSPH